MICPKCNANLTINSDFCPRCGHLFENEKVKKIISESVTDYIDIYFPQKKIGLHLDRICIPYIFFPISYPILKGMYYDGLNAFLILMLCRYGVPLIQDLSGAFGFYACFFIIIGGIVFYFYNIFTFNNKRIEDAYFRINKIKRENSEASTEDFIKLCEKDSKNHIFLFIISFIVTIVLLLI